MVKTSTCVRGDCLRICRVASTPSSSGMMAPRTAISFWERSNAAESPVKTLSRRLQKPNIPKKNDTRATVRRCVEANTYLRHSNNHVCVHTCTAATMVEERAGVSQKCCEARRSGEQSRILPRLFLRISWRCHSLS
jgi:hypothetical protein